MLEKKSRNIQIIIAMLLALCSGIGYTWSVFQKPLMEYFGWELKVISLTFTIQILVSTLAPVVLGRFQKRIGVRRYLQIGIFLYISGLLLTTKTNSIPYLYIIYGIWVGVGIAMLYPCLVSYATALMSDKTGLAAGLLACAYGSGAVFWAPLASRIMSRSGVLISFSVLAIIFAIIMLPLSFFIKGTLPQKEVVESDTKLKGESQIEAGEYTWQDMIRTSRYYILIVVLTLGATAGLMITGHASSMMQEILGYSAQGAAVLVGMFAISNATGRLVFGMLSDKIGRYQMMMILFGVIALSMIVLTQAGGVVFVIALFAIAACYGGFTAMISPVCADNFGMKNLAMNYGFLYVAYGLAGVVGPQLAANIRTMSGSYMMAFYCVAIMGIIGIILVLILKNKSKRRITDESS